MMTVTFVIFSNAAKMMHILYGVILFNNYAESWRAALRFAGTVQLSDALLIIDERIRQKAVGNAKIKYGCIEPTEIQVKEARDALIERYCFNIGYNALTPLSLLIENETARHHEEHLGGALAPEVLSPRILKFISRKPKLSFNGISDNEIVADMCYYIQAGGPSKDAPQAELEYADFSELFGI